MALFQRTRSFIRSLFSLSRGTLLFGGSEYQRNEAQSVFMEKCIQEITRRMNPSMFQGVDVDNQGVENDATLTKMMENGDEFNTTIKQIIRSKLVYDAVIARVDENNTITVYDPDTLLLSFNNGVCISAGLSNGASQIPVDELVVHLGETFSHAYTVEAITIEPKKQIQTLVNVESQVREWVVSVMRNSINFSASVEIDPDVEYTAQSDADKEGLKDELKNSFGGAKNAGKIFWGQGMKLVKHDTNMKFAGEYTNLMRQIRDEICTYFSVPPVLFGTESGQFHTSRVADIEFTQGTINPIGHFVAHILSRIYYRYAEGRQSRVVCIQYIPAKFVSTEEQDQIRQDYLAGIITLNEARTVNNRYDEIEDPSADRIQTYETAGI